MLKSARLLPSSCRFGARSVYTTTHLDKTLENGTIKGLETVMGSNIDVALQSKRSFKEGETVFKEATSVFVDVPRGANRRFSEAKLFGQIAHQIETKPDDVAWLYELKVLEPQNKDSQAQKLMNIIRCNGIERTDRIPAFDQMSAPSDGLGIFLASSYLDHSCLPNTTSVWKSKSTVSVHASESIPPETLLTTSVLGPSIATYSRKRRREMLKESHGFDCSCHFCSREIDTLRGFKCGCPGCQNGIVGPVSDHDSSQWKCSSCGTVVEKDEDIKLLQECETKLEEYEKTFTFQKELPMGGIKKIFEEIPRVLPVHHIVLRLSVPVIMNLMSSGRMAEAKTLLTDALKYVPAHGLPQNHLINIQLMDTLGAWYLIQNDRLNASRSFAQASAWLKSRFGAVPAHRAGLAKMSLREFVNIFNDLARL